MTYSVQTWAASGGASSISSVTRQAGVAGRATPGGQGKSNTGTNTGANSRVSHLAADALYAVRVVYGNFYNNGGAETDNTNDITVRGAVEYPSGTYIPVYFQGKRDVVINAGGLAYSDWALISIPANTQFWTRNFITVADNTKGWPINHYTSTLGEGAASAVSPTDSTTSGTITAATAFGYGPFAVQARLLAPGGLRLLGLGSARLAGAGDTELTNGWWGRAFDGLANQQRLAYPSEKAQSFITNVGRYRRAPLMEGSNVAISNYGIDDVSNGRTTAQLQADVITLWSLCVALGMKVFHCTLEPITTSTDAWATLVNQTVAAWNSSRTAFNNWLRDGAPVTSAGNLTAVATGTVGALRAGSTGHPLTGYLELADAAESARDSGKWRVDLGTPTTDGINASAVIHAVQAAVPNLTTLRAAAALVG